MRHQSASLVQKVDEQVVIHDDQGMGIVAPYDVRNLGSAEAVHLVEQCHLGGGRIVGQQVAIIQGIYGGASGSSLPGLVIGGENVPFAHPLCPRLYGAGQYGGNEEEKRR